MASNSFERNNTYDTITIESEIEKDTRDFMQKMKHFICIDVREDIERMVLSLGNSKSKQEDSEKNISSLKENLNALRQIIFDSSAPANTQRPELSTAQEVFSAMRSQISFTQRRKDKIDQETSRDLTRFLLNEMEEAIYRLEENINEVHRTQDKSIRHLKSTEKVLQEAELELEKEEKLKALKSNVPVACRKCSTSKSDTKCADVGVNTDFDRTLLTEINAENSNRSRRDSKPETTFRIEDDINPAKRLKIDTDISSPSTSKGHEFGYHSKRSFDKEKQFKLKEEYADVTSAEDESFGSRRSVEDHLEDAENHVVELRNRISTLEKLLMENRQVLGSLTESLDSIWSVSREEKRNRELEKMADAEFIQSLSSQSNWNQAPLSQPGPSNAESEPFTPRKTPPSSEFTWFGTPSKNYFDTRTSIAQEAIKGTIGPLNPEQMTCFLDEVRKKQNVMYLIRRFTDDVVSLVQQLKWIKSNLDDSYKVFISEPGNRSVDFDRRLSQRLETLIKNIERYI